MKVNGVEYEAPMGEVSEDFELELVDAMFDQYRSPKVVAPARRLRANRRAMW